MWLSLNTKALDSFLPQKWENQGFFNSLLHAVPARSAFFFEKSNAFFSPKNSKNKCLLAGCSVLDALNLEKCGVKIHNCALLLHFIAFFLVTPHACPCFLEKAMEVHACSM